MTPKQRMTAKKQMEADAQAELMTKGAKEAKGNYAFANQQRVNNMHAMAMTNSNPQAMT